MLEVGLLLGSYDDGTLLKASARLASATSDTWEVAGAGCRPDDDARGLLQFGRPPTEAGMSPKLRCAGRWAQSYCIHRPLAWAWGVLLS